MALPTTISAVLLSPNRVARRLGPWISSGGNVYVMLLDSTDISLVEMHKATDPTSSFSEADSADKPNLTNQVDSYSAVQVADVIHIATQESVTGRVAYHTFNMATDQWAIVNEQVVASLASFPTRLCVDLMVRSDGDVIIAYAGTRQTVTMSDFERVNYARRESASWTVDVALDNGGSVDWLICCVVPGNSDRSHFFFLDDSNDDAYQRCLRSDNTLETFPSAFDTSVHSTAGRFDLGPGTSYVSGGVTKVRCPYVDGSGATFAQCDSADTPSMSTLAFTTAVPKLVGNLYPIFAAAKNTDLYALYVNSTDSDLYLDVNSDDAGWGTDTSTFTGTLGEFSANVFIRSGNYKLAYVMDDGGVIKYNELDLGLAVDVVRSWSPAFPDQILTRPEALAYGQVPGRI